MMKTRIVPKHPPPSFFAPQPAASARKSLLMIPPIRAGSCPGTDKA
jgi:hypothetical protein